MRRPGPPVRDGRAAPADGRHADRARVAQPAAVRRRRGAEDLMVVTRSPADVLRLVVAAAVVVILLLVEWLFGNALVEFASDLLRGLDAVPQWIVDVVVIGTRVLQAAVLGGGLVWILYHRRWRMLVTVVAAGALAVVVFAALDALVGTDRGGDAVQT